MYLRTDNTVETCRDSYRDYYHYCHKYFKACTHTPSRRIDPLGIPLMFYCLLWRQRDLVRNRKGNMPSPPEVRHLEFLYDDKTGASYQVNASTNPPTTRQRKTKIGPISIVTLENVRRGLWLRTLCSCILLIDTAQSEYTYDDY